MAAHKAIWLKFQVEGVHHMSRWAEAYQSSVHRHMFQFRVLFNAADVLSGGATADGTVFDPIRIRRMCLQQFDEFGGANTLVDFGNRQCADIAEWLAKALHESWGRGVTVDVSEDGEVGATVTIGVE